MVPEVKNLPANAGDTRYVLDLWVGKIPLEEEIATESSILDWKTPMDKGAWWGTVHGVTKNQT